MQRTMVSPVIPRIPVDPLIPVIPIVEPLPVFDQPVLVPQEPLRPVIVDTFDPNRPDGPATIGQFRIDAKAPSLTVDQGATHIGAGESVAFNAKAVDPPSGPAPGSGVEAASYVWDFGDGTTGSGPTVRHLYTVAGTYTGAVAVRDTAGNVAQRAFAVKVSPLKTDGVAAVNTPKGRPKKTRVGDRARVTGAAALKGLGVSLRQPVLKAAWRASRLTGSINLRGTNSGAARLKLTLRAAGLKPVDLGRLPGGTGPFTSRLALPAGVLPGALGVEMAQGSRVVAKLRLQVPAPAEGVARAAFAATSRRGAPITRAPGSTTILFARFGLAALPAVSRPLTVTWFQPNGEVAGHPVRKPRSRTFTSFVRSGRPLPSGVWRAVLTAGGVRVAQAVTRVGEVT
jgi:chitodextrinase